MVTLSIKSFKVGDFTVPSFTLKQGEMMRIWIQVVPLKSQDSDAYAAVKEMRRVIQKQASVTEIKNNTGKLSTGLLNKLNPPTVLSYLQKNLKPQQTKELLSHFNTNPQIQMNRLNPQLQKLLSISADLMQNQVILFDYYGFGREHESLLTSFIKNELSKGKTAISFDNLMYKTDTLDSEMIQNKVVLRT